MTTPDPTPATPATDEQIEALRAAFSGKPVAFAPLTLIDENSVTLASVVARIDRDTTTIATQEAEIRAMRAQHAADLAAARRDERAACADVAMRVPFPSDCSEAENHGRLMASLAIRAAIRARGGSDAG